MHVAFQPARPLEALLRQAADACGFEEDFDPGLRAGDPRHGDLQANGVLPYAKRRKANPRALGQQLLDALLGLEDFAAAGVDATLAGPGFLNLSFRAEALARWLLWHGDAETLRSGARDGKAARRMVVDYSSPNTAKEMHVGHIRSTVIGEALARLLAFTGAEVIRDNHIGDWGTQFGMLIWAIKHEGYDLTQPRANAVAELERLYKQGHAAYKADDQQATAIRAELVKLQEGDPENTRIWERITEVSWSAFSEIYTQLGIRFDHRLGESFYRDQVERIYAELTEAGLAETSDGALVVFHPEHPRFNEQPFIIRKADGASNYASTDLATVLYRVEQWRAQEMIYVVDARQSDHFAQLFLTVEKWFAHTQRPQPALRHVSFGTILGEGGRPIKTKEGGSVKLRALLGEAVERAYNLVTTKNPELDEQERRRIARVVGLGAVRYADLSQNRTSDYVFSWEKMLSLDGNTAPYLLYAVARLHSLFRRAEADGLHLEAHPLDQLDLAQLERFAPQSPAEVALARKLIAFPAALELALGDLRPHLLCNYLYELAGSFSAFYNAEKILGGPAEHLQRRLLLASRTRLILETGLQLLGLETLERM